jgi:hypothetical protein
VYISGRDKKLIERAIYTYMLPMPHYVISDVGTNIYDLSSGEWQLLPQWHQEIAKDWNNFGHHQLYERLSDIKELRLQEFSKQNTYKLSYYFNLQHDPKALDARLTTTLEQHGIEATLVWSVDEPAAIGLLDILPRHADKYDALNYLRTLLAIPTESILFAGDSGNDLPLLASEIPAVLVANAMPSVADEAKSLAAKAGNLDSLYLAKGNFLDMNGNYSAGILEGVDYFHPNLTAHFENIEAHKGSDDDHKS